MKNKIIIFCVLSVVIFLALPIISHASVNPTLVRILNYYQDSDSRITFKWQQDYDGCNASGFDCSGGIQLSTDQFPNNGGEGFYNADDNFGSNKGFMNFTINCNELTAVGRICISHPKILINRNNNDILASNNDGLLYSDVASYVNSGGQMHTIIGGIFKVINDGNYRISATNHFSFGDVELPYVPPSIVKNPVLIIPGLMGTEMKNGDELLWADVIRMFTDIGDKFMDPLAFNKDLTPSNFLVSISTVITSKLGSDYTEGLINEFKNQGYRENKNLFTFPYDWRYGTSGKFSDGTTNVDLLAQKIQEIITQAGSDKVDIVTHSLGGLIIKKYIIDHPTDHHIGKAVFVGVPNTGAPKAIKVLLQGDNFDVALLKIPFLSQDEIKKISENLPAAYDLLPSQRYYNIKGSFVKIIDEGEFDDFNDYSEKDLNYQEFGNFLTSDHSLNSMAFTGAENLHTQSFDDFDLRNAGVDLYAINGCKSGTISKIIERRYKNILGQSFTEYKTPKFTPGDGTVPLESATNLPINLSHKFYSLTGEHSKMMSQDGSRQEIVNLISGSALEVKPKFITQDIDKCKLNGKAISVFSPIDIFVTDQDGNHLGNAGDNSIISEIPNAVFELFGDHKFLYLPTNDNQTYTVSIKGAGTGSYTITSQDIVDNEITKTEVFSNLPVTTELLGQINLGTETTLTIKETPSSADQIIFASANLAAVQSEDFASPVSLATLIGKTYNLGKYKGQYKKEVMITINTKDTAITGHENETSGVLNISYNLDNTGFKKIIGDSTNIIVSKEGSHTISFFGTDKAGNNEIAKTIYFVIKKADAKNDK